MTDSSNDGNRSQASSSVSGGLAMLAPSQAIRGSSSGSRQQSEQPSKKQGAPNSSGGADAHDPPTTNQTNQRRPNRPRRRGGGAKKKTQIDGQPPAQQQQSDTNAAEPREGRSRRRRGRAKKGIDQTPAAAREVDSGSSGNEKTAKNNINGNQKKNPPNKRKPKKKYPWRRFLPKGSVDPITLENLQTLEYPPFALCADKPYDPVPVWPVPEDTDEKYKEEISKTHKVLSEPDLEELNRRRLAEQWGDKVLSHSDGEEKKPPARDEPASNPPPPSKRPYNLFDGRALAYYMISQLQFIDPLNRRDLTRPELVNLDEYLKRHGLYTGDLNVTEAYDAKGITLSSAGAAAATAQGRANIMQQMGQQLLNALFTGQSVSSVEGRNRGGRTRDQDTTERQQAQSYSLQEQYAALQRQEHALAQQRHGASASHEPYLGDSGVYGSIDADGGGGFMIVDDDEHPELRGGAMVGNHIVQPERRERDDFPALASTSGDGRHNASASLAYSASHIARRYGDDLRRPDIPFPALPSRPGSQAAPAPAAAPAAAPPKTGSSKTLSKISGLVKKTDPEERQRQWEAREAARKRAMMSNLSYGMNPSLTNAADSLLTPPSLFEDDAVNTASEEKLERNRAFAEALGVKPATQRQISSGWSRPTDKKDVLDEFKEELSAAVYPQELLVLARERMPLLLKLEKKWKTFLVDDTSASLSLYPMDKPGRKLVHHYAEFWNLKTESFDPEPKRYVHCVKLPSTHMPHPLLSNAASGVQNSPFQSSVTSSGLTLLSH
jgi:R3H domain